MRTDPLQNRYQKGTDHTQCFPCYAELGYQDELGKDSCKQCPVGYRKRSVPPANTGGFRVMTDLCEACPKGWYNGGIGGVCAACAVGYYADREGSDTCKPCGGGACIGRSYYPHAHCMYVFQRFIS